MQNAADLPRVLQLGQNRSLEGGQQISALVMVNSPSLSSKISDDDGSTGQQIDQRGSLNTAGNTTRSSKSFQSMVNWMKSKTAKIMSTKMLLAEMKRT